MAAVSGRTYLAFLACTALVLTWYCNINYFISLPVDPNVSLIGRLFNGVREFFQPHNTMPKGNVLAILVFSSLVCLMPVTALIAFVDGLCILPAATPLRRWLNGLVAAAAFVALSLAVGISAVVPAALILLERRNLLGTTQLPRGLFSHLLKFLWVMATLTAGMQLFPIISFILFRSNHTAMLARLLREGRASWVVASLSWDALFLWLALAYWICKDYQVRSSALKAREHIVADSSATQRFVSPKLVEAGVPVTLFERKDDGSVRAVQRMRLRYNSEQRVFEVAPPGGPVRARLAQSQLTDVYVGKQTAKMDIWKAEAAADYHESRCLSLASRSGAGLHIAFESASERNDWLIALSGLLENSGRTVVETGPGEAAAVSSLIIVTGLMVLTAGAVFPAYLVFREFFLWRPPLKAKLS